MRNSSVNEDGTTGESSLKFRKIAYASGFDLLKGARSNFKLISSSSRLSCSGEKANVNHRHATIISRALRNVIALFIATSALVGCATDTPRQTITVLAASSMAEVLPEIAEAFEAENRNVTVRTSLAGSATLAAQVRTGIPADVLITASKESLEASGNRVANPRIFARNYMVLATNSSEINVISDLNKESVIWIRCDDSVPCGRAASLALENERVTSTPSSLESDVATVMGRVRAGQVDAGVVYRTNVTLKDKKIRVLNFKTPAAVDLYISEINDSTHLATARRFVNFLISSTDMLTTSGFEAVRK